MSGRPETWERIANGDHTLVIGRALARRIGGAGESELVPVFMIDDVCTDAFGRNTKWGVRCHRCGKAHRFFPRVGLHPAHCEYVPMRDAHGDDWTTCYLVRASHQAQAFPGFTLAVLP